MQIVIRYVWDFWYICRENGIYFCRYYHEAIPTFVNFENY